MSGSVEEEERANNVQPVIEDRHDYQKNCEQEVYPEEVAADVLEVYAEEKEDYLVEAEGEGDYCASFLGWASVFKIHVLSQSLRRVHCCGSAGWRIDRKNGKSEGEDYRGDGGVLAEKRSALIAAAEDLDKVRV